jgi:hypothetical protein
LIVKSYYIPTIASDDQDERWSLGHISTTYAHMTHHDNKIATHMALACGGSSRTMLPL